MLIYTDIPDLAFSSYFTNLMVSVTSVTENLTFKLWVMESDGYSLLIHEVYSPDWDLQIVISDLSRIIDNNLINRAQAQFKFSFVTDLATETKESIVIKSLAEIDISAVDFCAARFLTLLAGDKNTRPGSKEYVSFYGTDTNVSVVARYRNYLGEYEARTFATTIASGAVTTVDVSPRKYMLDGLILVNFTVTIGSRKQKFYVDNEFPTTDLQLVFKNNFGVLEFASIYGVLDYETEYTRTFGTVRGNYKAIDIDKVKNFTAYTGVLPQVEAEWFEDLFSSKYVAIVRNNEVWKEITITETKFTRSTARNEIPTYQFKYRLSQAKPVNPITPQDRIFDQTFDQTFN